MVLKSFFYVIFFGIGINNLKAAGSSTFGVPYYNDIETGSINTFAPQLHSPPLYRSHLEADRFIQIVKGYLNSAYPTISITTQQIKDAQVTRAAWLGTPFTQEMVYLCSHGWSQGFGTYDSYVLNSEKGYGGWTRWVFLQTCETLNSHNASDYLPMFQGVHAVFGHEAESFEFARNYNCQWGINCPVHRSEDWVEYFGNAWVYQGEYMWYSYSQAIKTANYTNEGYGIAPATVGISGYFNGKSFCGWNEKVTTIFSGDVSPTGLHLVYTWEIFGTPVY